MRGRTFQRPWTFVCANETHTRGIPVLLRDTSASHGSHRSRRRNGRCCRRRHRRHRRRRRHRRHDGAAAPSARSLHLGHDVTARLRGQDVAAAGRAGGGGRARALGHVRPDGEAQPLQFVRAPITPIILTLPPRAHVNTNMVHPARSGKGVTEGAAPGRVRLGGEAHALLLLVRAARGSADGLRPCPRQHEPDTFCYGRCQSHSRFSNVSVWLCSWLCNPCGAITVRAGTQVGRTRSSRGASASTPCDYHEVLGRAGNLHRAHASSRPRLQAPNCHGC